jgi:hypothetical protein
VFDNRQRNRKMSLNKVRHILSLLFLALGTIHVIVLIWSGIENVMVWKSLATLAWIPIQKKKPNNSPGFLPFFPL